MVICNIFVDQKRTWMDLQRDNMHNKPKGQHNCNSHFKTNVFNSNFLLFPPVNNYTPFSSSRKSIKWDNSEGDLGLHTWETTGESIGTAWQSGGCRWEACGAHWQTTQTRTLRRKWKTQLRKRRCKLFQTHLFVTMHIWLWLYQILKSRQLNCHSDSYHL